MQGLDRRRRDSRPSIKMKYARFDLRRPQNWHPSILQASKDNVACRLIACMLKPIWARFENLEFRSSCSHLDFEVLSQPVGWYIYEYSYTDISLQGLVNLSLRVVGTAAIVFPPTMKMKYARFERVVLNGISLGMVTSRSDLSDV